MTSPVPWQHAWEAALYGPDGFFRRQRPAAHFRTNAHLDQFATAIAALARQIDAASVVDMASGGGELLTALRPLLPATALMGVERGSRPAELEASIAWQAELPDHIDGLLIANEWLDNIPCPIAEVDEDGQVRQVLVDSATGVETLGPVLSDPWVDRWWPVSQPGDRVEVGAARDAAWADAAARVEGMAIAVDYGHLKYDRPAWGSLRSYRDGTEVEVIPDGSRDVTAHVAVDSVAEASGSRLVRQRDALTRLGVDGSRPPLDLARSDPSAYLRSLGRASESGELTARGGLGDFWWIVSDTSGRGTLGP